MPEKPGVQGDGEPKQLILGKYELGRLLGYGATAKVYLARNLNTGQSFAIKCFSKHRISKTSLSTHVFRELNVRRLRHPNIIRLHEILASRSKIYFILDLVKGGDLFARLLRTGRLPDDLCRRYFRQLISAVGYSHSRGVFHRDLKLENLLLDENGDLKISDFGLSAVASQIQSDGLFHTLCGTPAYVAPEILAKKGYHPAGVDIWASGVILFVLAVGYLPFNDTNLMAMYRKIYRGEYRLPKWVSPELRHLIGRLLDTNPGSRITVEEIVAHPWFRKLGFEEEKLAPPEEYYYCKVSKAEAVEAEDRWLNAFDIIGFSSGADLSGIFGVRVERERFVSDEGQETVLRLAEVAGRREGLVVSRKGERGRAGVALREHNGNLVVGVEIYRLSGELILVEVERGGAPVGRERFGLAGQFWREKLPVRSS
ncbi:CBL-interacting serine/threonine-protein kinase 11 [Platanthera guangdongensis]|uniref:non-specific serine/threonine protein kinase n=1 Tax=Platanthera guangdongensis TaxID=2320717 RepID=A0ABR2MBF4_9ASPA